MKHLISTTFFFLGLVLAGSSTAQTNFNCATCHGAELEGNMSIQAPQLAGMEPWYMKRQLENFKAGIRGSDPQDIHGMTMRPMAAMLSDADIDAVIEWVGTFDAASPANTVTGDTSKGANAYRSCAACHGAQGEGNATFNAPSLAGQNDWYLVNQLKSFKAGHRGSNAQDTYGKMMIQMAGSLANDQAINDVVSYINTLGQ
ncbi:MAG: c-type cytochrome [Gammaproteobacteria bacterium]|nr:c-type cytochrome [Pseudomonadales bacterium]MCP5345318.1 c-type cytochrome [Pseudomonadales bacterium]